MISDNALQNRLNAVKNGNKPPVPAKNNTINPTNKVEKTYNNYLTKSLSLLDGYLAAFLYGYGIKTLFNLEWNLFACFTVGFLISHSIFIFPKQLFPKLFK